MSDERWLTIDGVEIHDGGACYVIAEIGNNHQGSLEQAKQLVDAAKDCGVDAVKLQKRANRALYTREFFDQPYDNEFSFGRTYGEHREALELRTALRQFLSSSPTQQSVAAIELERTAARFPLSVTASRKRSLDLRPVVRRASSGLGGVLAELVRLSDSGRLERMKICSSDECHWVFYDRSKPGNRRWCSSDRCGNREKTRAYRDRQRRGD